MAENNVQVLIFSRNLEDVAYFIGETMLQELVS